MPSLKEIQRRLQKVTENKLQKKVEEIVLTDTEIREAKRNELRRGETPDGGIIGTYRSSDYELFKSQLNPMAGGTVDLILTGKFSNQLFVKSLGNSRFQFQSQDEKDPMLFEKYGQENRGLNEETFEELQRKKYAPKLVRYIKQITGL
jgi:hypothetical protein